MSSKWMSLALERQFSLMEARSDKPPPQGLLFGWVQKGAIRTLFWGVNHERSPRLNLIDEERPQRLNLFMRNDP